MVRTMICSLPAVSRKLRDTMLRVRVPSTSTQVRGGLHSSGSSVCPLPWACMGTYTELTRGASGLAWALALPSAWLAVTAMQGPKGTQASVRQHSRGDGRGLEVWLPLLRRSEQRLRLPLSTELLDILQTVQQASGCSFDTNALGLTAACQLAHSVLSRRAVGWGTCCRGLPEVHVTQWGRLAPQQP